MLSVCQTVHCITVEPGPHAWIASRVAVGTLLFIRLLLGTVTNTHAELPRMMEFLQFLQLIQMLQGW